MPQGIKKKIPPITQSAIPAGPPATAFESLVMKKRMTTNRNVRSRVVRMPGIARSTYDSEFNARSLGRLSGPCTRAPAGELDHIVFSLHGYTRKRQESH